MKEIDCFKPNDITHKEFGDTLREARKKGVNIIAVDCNITPDSIEIDSKIKIEL